MWLSIDPGNNVQPDPSTTGTPGATAEHRVFSLYGRWTL
jgi:hypothetical protein